MSAGAPNIAALLGGGGGPPNGQHTIQVQPPGGGGDPVAALRGLASSSGPMSNTARVTVDTVISDLHQLAGQMDDEGDKQTVLKCLAAIQGIKATEQKEKEAMLGTTAAHKGMAKAASQSQSY